MFAGQYFAQWYFAGNPFEVVPPPPPPPPPIIERCCRFGIGECIGESSSISRLPAEGVSGEVLRFQPVGQANSLSRLPNDGISGKVGRPQPTGQSGRVNRPTSVGTAGGPIPGATCS